MPYINTHEILGHLGRDPDVRHTASGRMVVNLAVATSYTTREGEGTDWHKVTAWEPMANNVAELKKGDLVYVKGRSTTRKWTDKNGNDRYTTECVATIAYPGNIIAGEQGARQEKQPYPQGGYASQKETAGPPKAEISANPMHHGVPDGDIPF